VYLKARNIVAVAVFDDDVDRILDCCEEYDEDGGKKYLLI